MSVKDEDNRNIARIIKSLDGWQCNCKPASDLPIHMNGVSNLSEFGFAAVVTEAVPSRYLRLRALRRFIERTKNDFVKKQVEDYLRDDTKHDSQIADNLAFTCWRLREKLEKDCPVCGEPLKYTIIHHEHEHPKRGIRYAPD